MTADGEFIDSLGNPIQRNFASHGQAIFKMVPDCPIPHSGSLPIAVFGSAQGTFSRDGQLRKEDVWKTPAAWRAVIKEGKIAVWQVYAGNEPIRRS